MVQEELTFPGEDPGIFACDYKKLARIMVAMGRGRLALARKDYPTAEVRSSPLVTRNCIGCTSRIGHPSRPTDASLTCMAQQVDACCAHAAPGISWLHLHCHWRRHSRGFLGERQTKCPRGSAPHEQGAVTAGLSCARHAVRCAQAHLRQALDIELGMGYMEPERLWQPVRHCLAYVLLRSGQAQAAAEVRQQGALLPP